MGKPRLIYYNDGHHFHGKRIDPPLSLRKLYWPVDEVVGTGVETLVFGLGYGDVFFHQSKTGRTIGEGKEIWENYIDWRIMRMVRDAKEMGTDQLREVVKRGREMGMPVVTSIKLNDGHAPGAQRCGWLRWEHGKEVCVDEPPQEWAHDYTNPLVIEDKRAIIREALEDYRADGIELDFMFSEVYFRSADIERGALLMSEFVGGVRELANEIAAKQDREITVMARVNHQRDANLRMGLDVETWLADGNLDLVVGQINGVELVDPGDVGGRWLADAANSAGSAAYLRPAHIVYDERTIFPHIEMFRALRQSVAWQGFAGLYLGYLPWPFSRTEYEILREVAYPEITERHDKRYFLQPREGVRDESKVNASELPDRQLPAPLAEGKTTTLSILVADEMDSARRDGEMREPILTIRFAEFCVEDEVEIRLNGTVLPLKDAEISDYHATRILAKFRSTIQAPDSFGGYWFKYKLDVDLLKQGDNTLEVEAKRFEPTAGFTRSISGVEIQTRYKDFVLPEGLNVERMAPTLY